MSQKAGSNPPPNSNRPAPPPNPPAPFTAVSEIFAGLLDDAARREAHLLATIRIALETLGGDDGFVSNSINVGVARSYLRAGLRVYVEMGGIKQALPA